MLFFVLFVRSVDAPRQRPENGGTGKADFPAQTERGIAVGQPNGVDALRQIHGHHAVPHQPDPGWLSVHLDAPISVLGNGSVQQTVPVAVNGSLHQRGAEFGQIQPGRRQNFIAPGEPLPVEYGGAEGHGAAFVLVALDADVDGISGLHIPHRDHLGQADGLLVQLHPVDADVEIVPLGQIQMDAHEAVPVGGVGIGHIRTGNAA